MRGIRTLALAAVLVPTSAVMLAAQQPAPDTTTISLEKARTTALAKVQNNEGVKSAKLKTKNGVLVYEFDIETPGPGHQEVRVDAHTGAVISDKHEDDLAGTAAGKAGQAAANAADAAKQGAQAAANAAENAVDEVITDISKANPAVSEAQARSIAQKAVPNAPIKDVDLERENGVLVWEIDLNTAGDGHEEVLIDATTGKILRQHHED
jgi:uncharacterized membrane protein YkoI